MPHTSEITVRTLVRLHALMCADVQYQIILGLAGVGAELALELAVLGVDAHVVV